MPAPALIAIDWGTTRLRAWLMAADGSVLAEQRSDDGLIEAQKKRFSTVHAATLEKLQAPAGLPTIICGMAGSRQGWIEAPYVPVPAPLDAVLREAARVPQAGADIRIVPGLAQTTPDAPDVMRGEETQLAGAGLPAEGTHLACMPGTHCKWVTVENGRVKTFGTWPTGELYALIAGQSILRHSLGEPPAAVTASSPAFAEACRTALAEGGDFSARLFSIRAGTLLNGLSPADAAARLSGLLIGAEIASARLHLPPLPARRVVLVASGPLAGLYGAAFALAGFEVRSVDAEAAVRAGLYEAARQNGMVA